MKSSSKEIELISNKIERIISKIKDAEWKIGSHITAGGPVNERFVESQIKIVKFLNEELNELIDKETELKRIKNN